MFDFKNKRVLVLAPHTDDAEFGCGGTIAKMVESGSKVFIAAFSACEQSVGYHTGNLIQAFFKVHG